MSYIEKRALIQQLEGSAVCYELLGEKDLPHLLRRAAAALAPQWQSIEAEPNGLVLFCDMAATELRNSFFVDWIVDGKFCGNRHHVATHWVPLPAAPEVGS